MDNKYKYVVNTCFNYKYHLIFLNDIDVETFLNECAKAFKITYDKAIVELTTKDNAVIPKEQFSNVIEQFSSCGCFCVHLKIEGMDDSPIVTPHDIEEYLISVSATEMLEHRSQQLTEKNRRQLIRHLSEYLSSKFSKSSNAKEKLKQKQAVARATVFLFPALKTKGVNGGIEIVMGYLNTKKKNERYAEKTCQRDQNESNNNDSFEGAIDVTERQKQDIEVLKATIVNESNLPEIQTKLKSTLAYRQKLLENRELDLKEFFPYFFTDPELITFDFSLHFPAIDCDAFIESWPANSVRLEDILKNKYQSSIHTMWSDDIQKLLILLKLLPAKANGRNLLTIASFNQAIDKLFVFRQRGIPINRLAELSNDFPYIVAFGDSKDKITHFYIEVEKQILNVPNDFTAAQVFDLFFKVHKIFNLRFDPNLSPMMEFVQKFIFGIGFSKGFRVSTRMKDLFNCLSVPGEQ